MENRIDQTFLDLRTLRRAGFMAYITGGDPTLAQTVDIALALADTGVDFLEIGVPFSDPLADGIANQLGAQRALAAGTTLPKLLNAISAIRSKSSIPIILYSYLNPIFQYGFSRFEQAAADSGIDGLLLLDLPPDETLIVDKPRTVHRIRLIAPTTTEDRIKQIVSQATGFVYYVSREGVTGERSDLAQSIAGQVANIRQYTRLPVAVGFGISTPDQARQVAAWADAVVVGSAIVRRIGELAHEDVLPRRIADFIRPLVEAVR